MPSQPRPSVQWSDAMWSVSAVGPPWRQGVTLHAAPADGDRARARTSSGFILHLLHLRCFSGGILQGRAAHAHRLARGDKYPPRRPWWRGRNQGSRQLLSGAVTAYLGQGGRDARVDWADLLTPQLDAAAPIGAVQVLQTQLAAKAEGYSDVAFLDAVHNKYLEEVSSCNIFVVKVIAADTRRCEDVYQRWMALPQRSCPECAVLGSPGFVQMF